MSIILHNILILSAFLVVVVIAAGAASIGVLTWLSGIDRAINTRHHKIGLR